MASRILDMGDVLTLIEQAEKTFDQEQALKAAQKLTGEGGDFTLDDFLEQMQQVRKLGSLSKIMGMLPGMGQFRDQLENFDEREIDRIQAVIQFDDPGRAGQPEADRRLASRPDREGLRSPGLRRQPARRPVLRGPQDDAAARPGRRDAGDARDARRCRGPASGARPSSSPRRARASGSPATPPRRRRRRRLQQEKAAPARQPVRHAGRRQVDYEQAAAALDLPKDFSKYLK